MIERIGKLGLDRVHRFGVGKRRRHIDGVTGGRDREAISPIGGAGAAAAPGAGQEDQAHKEPVQPTSHGVTRGESNRQSLANRDAFATAI
jgi:hypothetical protein